jgi:hypothetical protein
MRFSSPIGRATLGAALSLAIASLSLSARADEAPAPPASPVPPVAKPGPAMPAAAKSNPTGTSEEAKSHFAAGVSLLQDPEGEKVEEAYREFRTAYDLSGSPKILGNMGFCAMRLERDGEAIEAYTRYLREVPDIDAEERAQIIRDLQTLTIGLARLTIEVDKPGVRIVDVRIPVRGERVTNTYGPITNGRLEVGVRPGHHVLTAKLADHEDVMWEIDAFAASRDKNAFAMRPRVVAANPGEAGRSTNVGPIIVMSIGGAMLVGGAITGILALGKTHDIEDKCPKDVCPNSFDLEGERSSAKTFVRITDVLLIGGGIVTAGGLGWLLLANGEKTETGAPKSSSVTRLRLPVPSAGCGPDGCRASMKVVF